MQVRPGDVTDPQVAALLDAHVQAMFEFSPPETVHALDAAGLSGDDISLFTVWDADALVGMGALKELTPTTGEIKSMRTAEAHLRRGVAAFVLQKLIDEAQRRGYRRVSLETGTDAAFGPAIALYERFGFEPTGPFGAYQESTFNRFMKLDI